ncbi:A24 family peptidase [Nocardioides sp. KR10-350]|uniref:A24 family peptidase n=1 Tax=Nocardioides cheoyonin TaxID=3156615 RepID=UPI0032B4CF21
MSGWAVGGLCAVVAGLLGLLVPAAIARLPEPPPGPERESEADAPPETALERMLREEGPKEAYADVARLPLLGPLAALASAVVAGACGLRLAEDRVLFVLVPLAPLLVLLSIVDWRTRLLPRIVVLPATGVVLLLVLLEWALTGETHVLVRALVAMLVARSFFWLLWFVRQAGMGFGDVRLAALVGLVLGRLGWNDWVLGLYGGLVVFALWGIGRAVVKRSRASLKQALPYGPFMVLGLVLGVLVDGSVTLFS